MCFYIIPGGVKPCRNALDPLYSFETWQCGMNDLIKLTWGTKRDETHFVPPHCVIHSDNTVVAFT